MEIKKTISWRQDFHPRRLESSCLEQHKCTLIHVYTGWWCNMVQFHHLEKWWSSSMGRMTSHIWSGKYNSCCKPPTSIGVYINIPMHLWWSTCRDPGVQIPMFWSQICCEILASTLTKRQKVIFVIGKSSNKRSHCYVSWTTGIPLKTLHVALGTVLTTYKNGDDWWCKWHCFSDLISKKQLKSPCFTLQ